MSTNGAIKYFGYVKFKYFLELARRSAFVFVAHGAQGRRIVIRMARLVRVSDERESLRISCILFFEARSQQLQ